MQTACAWEVLARKAGNVCPGRDYADLTVNDFLVSAAAIAPVLDRAPFQPLGVTVLAALQATRRVVATNTNLGMVLLLAPLASVPLEEPLTPALAARLRQTTLEDSRHVYEAIRLAQPSGLGDAPQQDIRAEPSLPLREVMLLAASKDFIAKQYGNDFHDVLNEAAPALVRRVQECQNLERGIVAMQLALLSRQTDSHILRKCGSAEAEKVKEHAQRIMALGGAETEAGRQAYRAFDAWLRADNHARNPGTMADLLAACLFVALRRGEIDQATPLAWDDHPLRV